MVVIDDEASFDFVVNAVRALYNIHMGLIDFLESLIKQKPEVTKPKSPSLLDIEKRVKSNNTIISTLGSTDKVAKESKYSGKTAEELLALVPENHWKVSLIEYYTEYYDFYKFFMEGIEKKQLPSLAPYTNCFYDWFRGVMAEKESLLLRSSIIESNTPIQGSIVEDTLQCYFYICRNHAIQFIDNAYDLLKRCKHKKDFNQYYDICKKILANIMQTNDLILDPYVRIFRPYETDYIPPSLFVNSVNCNRYLTDLGQAHLSELKDTICEKLTERYYETGNNYINEFFETSWYNYRAFDSLSLVWPEDITEQYWVPEDSYINLTIKHDAIKSFLRDCENCFRKKEGLPKIGEGWISETVLFKQLEEVFDDQEIIQHASPAFLGKQHYDVYFPDFKIAIEYQGKQHFEAVDFFGGEDSLKRVKELDVRKRKVSEENDIILIEALPNYNLSELVDRICQAANTENPLLNREIDEIITSEETIKQEIRAKKIRLKNAKRKPVKEYTEEQKEQAQLKLSEIRRRYDEGFWVTVWERSFLFSNVELLGLTVEDVDAIVDSMIIDLEKVNDETMVNYADLYKRAINYYKKNKLYDKAIDLARFAIQNSLRLRDGVKKFEPRLDELIKLKAIASQTEDVTTDN